MNSQQESVQTTTDYYVNAICLNFSCEQLLQVFSSQNKIAFGSVKVTDAHNKFIDFIVTKLRSLNNNDRYLENICLQTVYCSLGKLGSDEEICIYDYAQFQEYQTAIKNYTTITLVGSIHKFTIKSLKSTVSRITSEDQFVKNMAIWKQKYISMMERISAREQRLVRENNAKIAKQRDAARNITQRKKRLEDVRDMDMTRSNRVANNFYPEDNRQSNSRRRNGKKSFSRRREEEEYDRDRRRYKNDRYRRRDEYNRRDEYDRYRRRDERLSKRRRYIPPPPPPDESDESDESDDENYKYKTSRSRRVPAANNSALESQLEILSAQLAAAEAKLVAAETKSNSNPDDAKAQKVLEEARKKETAINARIIALEKTIENSPAPAPAANDSALQSQLADISAQLADAKAKLVAAETKSTSNPTDNEAQKVLEEARKKEKAIEERFLAIEMQINKSKELDKAATPAPVAATSQAPVVVKETQPINREKLVIDPNDLVKANEAILQEFIHALLDYSVDDKIDGNARVVNIIRNVVRDTHFYVAHLLANPQPKSETAPTIVSLKNRSVPSKYPDKIIIGAKLFLEKNKLFDEKYDAKNYESTAAPNENVTALKNLVSTNFDEYYKKYNGQEEELFKLIFLSVCHITETPANVEDAELTELLNAVDKAQKNAKNVSMLGAFLLNDAVKNVLDPTETDAREVMVRLSEFTIAVLDSKLGMKEKKDLLTELGFNENVVKLAEELDKAQITTFVHMLGIPKFNAEYARSMVGAINSNVVKYKNNRTSTAGFGYAYSCKPNSLNRKDYLLRDLKESTVEKLKTAYTDASNNAKSFFDMVNADSTTIKAFLLNKLETIPKPILEWKSKNVMNIGTELTTSTMMQNIKNCVGVGNIGADIGIGNIGADIGIGVDNSRLIIYNNILVLQKELQDALNASQMGGGLGDELITLLNSFKDEHNLDMETLYIVFNREEDTNDALDEFREKIDDVKTAADEAAKAAKAAKAANKERTQAIFKSIASTFSEILINLNKVPDNFLIIAKNIGKNNNLEANDESVSAARKAYNTSLSASENDGKTVYKMGKDPIVNDASDVLAAIQAAIQAKRIIKRVEEVIRLATEINNKLSKRKPTAAPVPTAPPAPVTYDITMYNKFVLFITNIKTEIQKRLIPPSVVSVVELLPAQVNVQPLTSGGGKRRSLKRAKRVTRNRKNVLRRKTHKNRKQRNTRVRPNRRHNRKH